MDNNFNLLKQNDEKPTGDNVKLGIIFIIISAFSFAVMSLFVRLAGDLPVFQKTFFRNLIASFFTFFLLLKSGNLKMKKGSLLPLLGRSIAGTIGIICNFYAIDHLNLADASILNKLSPIFSVLFSIFLLKEKASPLDWLLIFFALVGAVFIAKPSFDVSHTLSTLVGFIGGLGAGLAYAFVRVLGKNGERPSYIVFFFSTFSCIAVIPFMIFDYHEMTLLQLTYLLLAGVMACIAQYTVTLAYKFAPAKEVSLYGYTQIIFSALLGFVFVYELPDIFSIIGYVIIVSSSILKSFIRKKTESK